MTSAQRSTLREIYRDSSDNISHALTLFGPSRSDGGYEIPCETEYDNIAYIIAELLAAQSHEEEGAYRTTILAIAEWLNAALDKDYLGQQNNLGFPSIVYVVKKGFEVLHCLLHRDLRRRQLSQTEAQLVQEFVRLAGNYPNPCIPGGQKSAARGRKSS
jgi:hypothetical protein